MSDGELVELTPSHTTPRPIRTEQESIFSQEFLDAVEKATKPKRERNRRYIEVDRPDQPRPVRIELIRRDGVAYMGWPALAIYASTLFCCILMAAITVGSIVRYNNEHDHHHHHDSGGGSLNDNSTLSL